jgi:glycosyltransferase involved in cell wall biosynthesis
MWEALIALLESGEPTILFGGYDFVGNSVLPALSERVGAVLWAQSDDGDYYEQAYRLGRYCNAVVCVSGAIRDEIAALNPAIGERAVVIHNTSVREADLDARRAPREERIRLVYTGRLVQYQKRILDFVPLADALAARGVDFTIELIGSFTRHDPANVYFPRRAAEHLERGTIRHLGRQPREVVMRQLRASDMFVLLSDFEGLPLSLVEAMATGCVPIVATMQSGIPELIQHTHNGLIQKDRDYNAWADAIIDLHTNTSKLDTLSRNAQQTIRDHYTIEQIGSQFHDLFNGIASDLDGAIYERPPALTWGGPRAVYGNVLPPPLLYEPDERPWVGLAKPVWRALPTGVRDSLRRIAGV